MLVSCNRCLQIREVHGVGDTFDVSWSHDGTMLCSCFSSGSLHVLDVTSQANIHVKMSSVDSNNNVKQAITTSITATRDKDTKSSSNQQQEALGIEVKIEEPSMQMDIVDTEAISIAGAEVSQSKEHPAASLNGKHEDAPSNEANHSSKTTTPEDPKADELDMEIDEPDQ
jgi:hypothetical protein